MISCIDQYNDLKSHGSLTMDWKGRTGGLGRKLLEETNHLIELFNKTNPFL